MIDVKELEKMSIAELIEIIQTYEKRFQVINELMMSYGEVSNDDLLGLIQKALPEDVE